jgi:hypothetical protein
MPRINFDLSAGATTRVTTALKGLYPIPEDADGNPLFTDGAWAKEKTRQWLKEQVKRWEQRAAMDNARDAVTDIDDGEIA